MKALVMGEIPIWRPISDREFFLHHEWQRMRFAWRTEYKFSALVQVIEALGLFKHLEMKGDLQSVENRSRLGIFLAKLDSKQCDICGVLVELKIFGRGNSRRYIAVSGPSSLGRALAERATA
jgi:hypothetical protein